MKRLIIACLQRASEADERLRRFAEWMGVETQLSVIDAAADIAQQFPGDTRCGLSLAMNAGTLATLGQTAQSHQWLRFIAARCTDLLVFGCDADSSRSDAVRWLTRGAVDRVMNPDASAEAATCVLPGSGRGFSRQLAGLDFPAGEMSLSPFFACNKGTSTAVSILSVDQRSVFMSLPVDGCQVFLAAGSEMPEIDQPIATNDKFQEKYPDIIPFLVYFRSCFGDESWHGTPGTARLIIDDPLLGDRYGWLDFRALLKSMNRETFGTSIAFIPWNHGRTAERWVEANVHKDVNLSICVHGCDHSNREFESLDSSALMQKASLALERMVKHESRTQMPFEKVMVFPQGRFSKAAIHALRANSYLAAVNTSCFPVDHEPGDLRLGDFLRPAITRFHGFPIFRRHYPQRFIEFGLDLFLGRPALLVEHHEYFENGCGKIEQFVRRLREMEPQLSWPALTTQLSETSARRILGRDLEHVHFFTKRFLLNNASHERRRFLVERDEPDPSVVRAVLVDARSVPFRHKDNRIEFELEMLPNEVRTVEVQDYPQNTPGKRTSGIAHNVGVFVRRELSEFRDNQLSRHPTLLKTGKQLVRHIKMTGDRGGPRKGTQPPKSSA